MNVQDLIRAASSSAASNLRTYLNQWSPKVMDIAAVRQAYAQDGLKLVLGAGVSCSADFPSWNVLVSRLLVSAMQVEGIQRLEDADIIGSTFSAIAGASAPIMARQIKHLHNSSLIEPLRRELYRGTQPSSAYVDSLAKLCQKRDAKVGIVGVLTYNYDTLMEERLAHFGRDFIRLDRSSPVPPAGFNINHVHGFVGRTQEDHEWIVLSEDEYHEQFADPYSWSNIVQLNAFRNHRCLFVGSSLTDPNTRRLLETARRTLDKAPAPHFAVLERTLAPAVASWLPASWEQPGRPSASVTEDYHRALGLVCDLKDWAQESVLGDLGVRVIWVEDRALLPKLIDSIRA